MRRLRQTSDALLTGLALIGAVATVLLMLHVFADVLMRNLYNQPIPATFEVVTNYCMIALAFIPLAWVERSGGMVQVEVIKGALSPAMMRVGLNVFVIRNVAGHYVSVAQILKGVIPFLAADIVVVIIVIAFPAIILYLPGLL